MKINWKYILLWVRSSRGANTQGQRKAHRYEGRLLRAKILRLSQLGHSSGASPYPQGAYVQLLLLEPQSFWTSFLYSSCASSFPFPPVFYTHNHILVLVVMENFLSEMSIFSFPFWPPIKSFYFVTHPFLLSVFIHFIKASGYLALLHIFPFLSLFSSLQLGPHESSCQPLPYSHSFGPCFRQNLNPWPLQLFIFLFLLTKLLCSYYQNTKHFWENNHRIMCALAPICSHAVMISSLHWVFHRQSLVICLSFTRHPFPAYILLCKVQPCIYSFLRRWLSTSRAC